MDKKPRSDSKLDALPKARVAELRDGLLGGWSYEAALAWLHGECGIKSSLAALSAFFKRHCTPVIKDRRQLASLRAEAIGGDAGLTDWDAASIERLRQMVFEFMANPNADLEATERMFRLLLKSRDQEVDRRKLALLETKAKRLDALEAKAREITAGGGLSAETLEVIEKQLKLL
jgi:hypothetical protein